MKPKQKENISKYIAYFLRTIGGAMIFIAFSAIVFSKNEAMNQPAATILLLVLCNYSLTMGLWVIYIGGTRN